MSGVVPPAAEALIADTSRMAHFATSVEDRPHVAPVWYHYDEDTIEILTTGRKLENVEQNPRVAISIQHDEGGDAKWMVTMRGTASVIRDVAERRAAARRINPKYGAEAEEWPENTLVRVAIGSCRYQTY